MTTEDFFKNLSSSLELKDSERDRVSKKHIRLRESLREKLPVEEDFLTGSYGRNTLIRPKDSEEKFDVDFFLAFNNEDYGESELSELLDMVKSVLEKIKEEDGDIEEIKEQKRSLGIAYKDNFQIDVVPAIQIEKDMLYKIFDKNSLLAVKSNPKLHGQNLTDANDRTESGSIKRLVPIVKILKSWKREKCEYIKSFHLEMLAVELLNNEKIESFSQGIGKFFLNAEDYLRDPCLKDPANEENIIDGYLGNDDRDEIFSLVIQEKKIAKRALELKREGKEEMAIKEWKKIFNSNDKTSKAIKKASFYPGDNGVVIRPHPRSSNGQRITPPRTWRS